MKINLMDILACPECSGSLKLENPTSKGGEVLTGELHCSGCGKAFPIAGGVARFVPRSNYTENFGFQWKKFRQTQLDSHSGLPISGNRFYSQSGWTKNELKGKRVLDVGCGAGRFTEIAVASGAEVVSIDFSEAVDACHLNHGHNPNLNILQADIYKLPFRPGSFDYVYCFGVLQHTPDVKKSFLALPAQLKPGGSLAVDVYRKHWSNWTQPKYYLRPFTKRIPNAKLFVFIEKAVPAFLILGTLLGKIPVLGRFLLRLLPVVNYSKTFPLNQNQQREWSILDTFDWYGPEYDQPQSAETLRRWFEESGMEKIEVHHPAHLSGTGRKPGGTPESLVASQSQLKLHENIH